MRTYLFIYLFLLISLNNNRSEQISWEDVVSRKCWKTTTRTKFDKEEVKVGINMTKCV